MLKRICNADGSFQELESQWSDQCKEYDEELETYAAPHLELARKICAENPQDPKYGIYALEGEEGGDGYIGLMHVNVARLPQTTGKTLRLVWILLAPKYDYEDIEASALASISTQIVLGVLDLCKGDAAPDQIKIHLGSIGDRQYFNGFCAAITGTKLVKEAVIKGNWLHITP